MNCERNSALINQAKFIFINAGINCSDEDTNAWIIHEDIYRLRPVQLISRIRSMTGLNTSRIHGRNTTAIVLTKQEARDFCEEHHLLGFCGGAVYVGLQLAGTLVAVAVFSKSRWMKYETPKYHSTELVRYCTSRDVQVAGGLDKLIRYFLKTNETDDIITYIDKEWSNGKGYLKIGFEFVAETPPLTFVVSRKTFRRKLNTNEITITEIDYLVENRGNIKLKLKVC